LQSMDQNFIVASKRCCPICWELLDILRGKTKRFRVRGRHATLYPVELPEWLSPQVLGEMITRFQEIIYDEILRMLKFESLDNCPPSRQSISDLSTGSHTDEAPLQTDEDSTNDFMAQLGDKGNLFNEPDKEHRDSSESLAKDKAGQATSNSPTSGKSIFGGSTQLKSVAPERLCQCLYLKRIASLRPVVSGPMAHDDVGYVSIGRWSILL
jgi:hypothetical protein